MKILFLSRWYPVPPDNGSKIRVLNLLRSLCEKHGVCLVSFTGPGENPAIGDFPDPAPEEIRVCPYNDFNPRSRRAMLGYLGGKPRWIADTHSREMESLVRGAVERNRFDLVIASQTSMAAYFKTFSGIPSIFEEAELGCFHPGSLENISSLDRIKANLRWAKHRRYIAGLLPHFNACTVASEIERCMVSETAPGYLPVHVIPNGIDLEFYERPARERNKDSLIFAGSLRYAANLQAVTWFLDEIFPVIRSEKPDAAITITGDPGENRLPETPGVTLSGKVRDVHAYIEGAAVSVAPIRTGGGTRFKILEAFALGTPVVATSKAAEGLDAEAGKHFLRADTPRDFAQSVLRLLRNAGEARELAGRAREFVHAHYDWRNLSPRFLEIVQQASGL
ncbi:MAG: glycosyltransferase [Acidobacteria bacterium]|nr:glycosyltransferase [Acidobacteriota bacterium]